ncbi:MAG: helix-turn-helix domain-containing protein [Synergistaceae bacterium]|nr:helix-turn-helix domain-containing protein [Synergistaceae bacterium]
MALASNIRIQRKRAGLTQIELAEKLGVSIATLRRWEAGETAPTGTRIIELANLLGISPDDIIAGEESSGAAGHVSVSYPVSENSNGMLVYEGEGTRIELPPTEKGYEIFQRLIENLINKRKAIQENEIIQAEDQQA